MEARWSTCHAAHACTPNPGLSNIWKQHNILQSDWHGTQGSTGSGFFYGLGLCRSLCEVRKQTPLHAQPTSCTWPFWLVLHIYLCYVGGWKISWRGSIIPNCSRRDEPPLEGGVPGMGAPTTRRRAFYSGTTCSKPSILMCTVTFGCREMHNKPPRTVLHRCVHKAYSSRHGSRTKRYHSGKTTKTTVLQQTDRLAWRATEAGWIRCRTAPQQEQKYCPAGKPGNGRKGAQFAAPPPSLSPGHLAGCRERMPQARI